MKFDELDRKMRVFETSLIRLVLVSLQFEGKQHTIVSSVTLSFNV
jgi:hypothetical protein